MRTVAVIAMRSAISSSPSATSTWCSSGMSRYRGTSGQGGVLCDEEGGEEGGPSSPPGVRRSSRSSRTQTRRPTSTRMVRCGMISGPRSPPTTTSSLVYRNF
jgi:hypothetical protein